MKRVSVGRPAALLSALLLGVAAFLLVLAVTEPPGPGLDPDALAYMGAAQSLADHMEYRIPSAAWTSADSTAPLAHFPPGYSSLLAVPVRLGMAPVQAARLVDALAAFATITVLVVLLAGAGMPLSGVLLALALFTMDAMAEVHLSVLSEPAFLLCVALTLAALVGAPDRPLRAGVPAAVGASTRYAGLALVGAAVLWSLVRPAPIVTRVRRAAIALLPTLVVQGAWVLRTHHLAGPASIRRFSLYGDLRPTLDQGGETLSRWLIPDPGWTDDAIPYRGRIALAAGILLVALVAAGVQRARRTPVEALATRLLAAGTLLLVSYMGMIVASRLVADAAIPFDQRILAPGLLLATVLVATATTLWWRNARMPSRAVVAGALVVWAAAGASVVWRDARYALEWGSDFAGAQWRSSELLEWGRTPEARHPLYTNWPAAVYFHLQRPARDVPQRGDVHALAAFADTLCVRDGRVLVFAVPEPDLATDLALSRQGGLRVLQRFRDGIVLAPVTRERTQPSGRTNCR